MDHFSVEVMGNGLAFIRERRSGLTGCYDNVTGQYRHGGLRLATHIALALICDTLEA